MPKEMKPKRTTLTAADRRLIKEIIQAELLPIKDELKRLRRVLIISKGSGSIE